MWPRINAIRELQWGALASTHAHWVRAIKEGTALYLQSYQATLL